MESKRYQNLYPELSPSKDEESFDNRRQLTDEDAEFCRELEKVKMLSIITAQEEEKQRQLEKSMLNSYVQPQVPILKPPPRLPRQHIDSLSESSKGFARPKPILNPPTNGTSDSFKTAQVSSYLTVDVNPRSHSVPPLFKNEETTNALRVSNDPSNKELIQLSPAISDRSVNVDFDVRQLDPLFSGTNVGYASSAPPPIGFCNFTIPKSSEPSNFMPFATVPRKNYSFTSSAEISKLTQPGDVSLHGFDLPTNPLAQVPPPLPAKAPRGQWNALILCRDPWQPSPRFSFPPPPPLPPSSKLVQGFQLPMVTPTLHLPILPSPVSSGSLLSFANNNLAVPNRSGNPFSTSDSNIARQFSNPFFGFSDTEKEVEDGSREPNGMNNNDLDDDNDLIHFPDSIETNHLINPTYMSLADFDPLFDMQNQTKAKKNQKPDHSKEEVNTVKISDSSDPVLPRRKVISLPTASSIENNAGYPVLEQRVSIIPASWSFSPDSRPNVNNEIQVFRVATNAEHSGSSFDFDWEDPDDPFSICHLVRKSKRHHQQQQQQRMLTTSESSSQSFEVKEAHARTPTINKYATELLEESPETADEEIRAFLQMVARIKLLHPINDTYYNSGIVISPQTVHKQYINLTVKLIITGSFVPDELVFVSDVNSTVEHVIIQALMLLVDDRNISPDSYILKVFGSSEYLINKSLLSDYEYVQQCLKLGKDIKFIIQQVELIQRPFQRTAEDINHPVYVPKVLSADDCSSRLTMSKLNILLETFYKECEKLKTLVLQSKIKVNCSGVVQSVKAICTMMNSIETVDVTKAISRLKTIVSDNEVLRSPTGSSSSIREACVYETNETCETPPRKYSDVTKRCIDTSNFMDDLQSTLNELLRSIKCLVDMFCRTFHKEFRFKSFMVQPKEFCDISSLNEFLIVHLATAHRIPNNWRNVHSEFFVQCRIYNGGHQVGREVWSQGVLSSASLNQSTITWDEWLTFDDVRICDLPREAKLCFTLIGCRMAQNSTNDGQTKVRRILAWVAIQLFNHQFELVQGDHLLGMWPGSCSAIAPTTDTNTHSSNSVLLQVSMQNFDHLCTFPKIEEMNSAKQDFDMLHPDDQNLLLSLIERDPIVKMSEDEKEFLWQKRHYLYSIPSALPKVLQSITSWACYSLSETYTMIRDWTPMGPMQSLQLLLPRFSDMIVRCLAVDKLRELPADDFCDLLPQLIQALKFEFYHTSALARLLLERSATSVRVAHHVYWLLKDAADDVHHRKRYQLMFGALMSVVGEKMRNEFGKQEEFVNMLAAIADKVKAAKDKDAVLQRELCNMWDFLQHKSVRLPTNPALEVAGVDVKSCSFFTSFTVPLKLAFKNIDPSAGDIYVMFKAGDDLRQDSLTLQMIRIMDRLWLQDGLDLKVVTFKCLPTSLKKGFVELIPESDTLGKIQKKHGHGVTGSFKDRPIAEWLQMHNPSELDYQAAVDNFTASCAGYCVATYVLGVCDRHNDNIMIKHSGHIFHIDYAKFLGDLQMLGAINRDRTPFILTSDMAYVINGGDKPTEKFQKFVDLCCHALNIIRRNSGLFINLFSLMTLSGVPRVNENAPRYVREALMPERSDAEAVAEFTRMVNTSLKSIFTQFNFFIHNLAQLKFSGHDEGMLLSFVPKTYSISTDGRIKNLELHGIQKRYNPEKFYIFIVKVERLNQKVPSFVLRRFSEFQELHRKLVATFPLVQWPSLSGKIILGRAHVKVVAELRKAELEVFLKSLLKMSSEVAEHDLVYTFFHPMLRDEQENKTNLLKLKETQPSPVTSTNRFMKPIEGSIKLSIFYKPHGLIIMVMHVKDLGKTSSGELPSPYVKLYLLPDPMKQTKRKTKIAKNTSHPTYNEMLIYRIQAEHAAQKVLQVTVWSYDGLKENEFLGGVHIRLAELDFSRECIGWHKLQTLHMMSMSSSMS